MGFVQRLPAAVAILGVVALVATLAFLVAGPVEVTHRSGTTSCGSLIRHVEPDPTAEWEFGCSDVFGERRQWVVLVAAVGGPLVAALGLAALAHTAAARSTMRDG